MCLTRKRGGRRKTVQRLRAVLNAHRRDEQNGDRSPDLPVPIPSARPILCDIDKWKNKLKKIIEHNSAPNPSLGRIVKTITQEELIDPTPDNIQRLKDKHTDNSSPIPNLPVNAPTLPVNDEDLEKLIVRGCNGRRGGASGWTSELLKPLFSDPTCRQGITLLIQLIINNELDDHSRLGSVRRMSYGTDAIVARPPSITR